MGAVTAAVIAIAGVLLGWATIEIACKPCLEKGREAIDRDLNPDYDPDDRIRSPLLPPDPNPVVAAGAPHLDVVDDDDRSVSASTKSV